MKKALFFPDAEIPDDILNEIIILYHLGASLEELKYILALKEF